MMTRERFAETNWKMSYEEFKKCYCPECKREECPHRESFRRVPEIDGGLGLCPKMNGMTREILRKELECGKRLKDLFEFSDGQDCTIYKGKFDLNNAENIIYIPDIFLNDIDIDTDFLTEMEIKNVLNYCYTTEDFLKEAQGHVNLAESLFDNV